MRSRKSWRLAALPLVALLAGASVPQAQKQITPPRESLGFGAGDDYCLANYTQLLAYFKTLDSESDRIQIVEIGKTAEGRPMVMAIITSPANHAKLEHYRGISRRLALAEGLTDEEARRLAQEGKAVVWIDGGLHGTEVVPAQGLFEMAYQMASRQDAETLRILDDVILLLTPVNPDGMELVSNWYMREKDPKRRSTGGLPVLYQKYVGHDNNRDSYMANQPETEAINRQLFVEWIPQIMYNQHQ
ncbi:MAG: peptidase, partial [Acidobacteria bacterium]